MAGNNLYWEKDFSLDDIILRIRGVNSALVSNDTDHQQTSRLVLGSHQSSLTRSKGVIHMILCHHPPDWLIDGEDVRKDFKSRARIHLYGHKHSFDVELINNECIVLSAGAMQPSRAESGWEPRYNIIELNTIPMADKPTLNVRLYKRVWKKATKTFIPDFEAAGEEYVEYPMVLTDLEISTNIAHKKKGAPETVVGELKLAPMVEPIINLNMPDPKRRLAYLFLGLPYHTKVIIAAKLKLIDDSDRNLPESQKTQLYFKRATEQGILSTLWDEVSAVSDVGSKNPFIQKS
ncbi:hypothetical protein IM792_04280 [Mucilaginibacter sp. JRF]|uniref:hypothetical protein n=1 Tax=Mucilaginibacter sp. JRF TaxID=2780088 RepID=UPI00187ED7A7|nr:hypothetical protein [Mucilaginibacter sp. JRF]MBE9583655.1 hypothetical protein [Mucilaginibacter sp. JRF]